MAHCWWNRPTKYLTKAIETKRLSIPEPYIGFHVRLTDNASHLEQDFGRDPLVTRSFDRFMSIAERIRNYRPDLGHIYVATDNIDIARLATLATQKYESWTFHLLSNVPREKLGSEFMWFKDHRSGSAGGIGADIETLRRADYLVGSFQSNVYRLATELNTAYHTAKYSWTEEKRIYGVDVEWYEDP